MTERLNTIYALSLLRVAKKIISDREWFIKKMYVYSGATMFVALCVMISLMTWEVITYG